MKVYLDNVNHLPCLEKEIKQLAEETGTSISNVAEELLYWISANSTDNCFRNFKQYFLKCNSMG